MTILIASVAFLLASAAVALPGQAAASEQSGSLSALSGPNECVGETEEQHAICSTQVPFGLNLAYEVQASPDGRNVYSVSIDGDLIEYSRNLASGALEVIGCITASTRACASQNATEEVALMEKPTALAISPNGQDVYVAVSSHNAVVELERETATGLLKVMSSGKACVTGESGGECEIREAKGFNEPYGIVVSPDGESVYVASVKGESIAELGRNTTTGLLEEMKGQECIGGHTSGCPVETAQALVEPIGVAVSPDGKNVYVAAGASNHEGEIASFKREAGGVLKQLPKAEGCISETIVTECAPGIAVDGSEDLVVSPDGKNVYATSFLKDAVVEMERNATTGALTQLASPNACVTTASLAGCSTVKAIGGTRGLAISPDGDDLYVSSTSEASVAALQREASSKGALASFEASHECVTTELGGCGISGLIGLEGARRLTVSPDGTNVYVAAQGGNSIAELARTVTPSVSKIAPTTGSEAGGTEVTIEGAGFADGASVEFGGASAVSVIVDSASEITAVSPAGATGKATVSVTNLAGASASVPADEFAYTTAVAPTVSEVSPFYGSESGGTQVTISGTEFLAGASVDFGGTPAREVKVDSGTSITAVTPPGTGGQEVTVTTSKGTSTTGEADRFKYVFVPPHELGGLDLNGYCSSLGYVSVALQKGQVVGPNAAYENWACVEKGGHEVLIAATGVAPSMENACKVQHPGSFAYAEEANDANSWKCFEEEPPSGKAGGEKGPSGGGKSGEKATTASVPQPKVAETGNVAPVSGTVLVKLPGAKAFVPLTTLTQIPFGSVIEATNGHVSVTVAEPGGGIETGEFFDGQFVLTQEANGMTVATLTGGNFSVCPRRYKVPPHDGMAIVSSASGKHVVRKLWANAHGKFTTKGNYAAGAVQGTEWLTEDLCEGTLIRVTRDKVAVTNLLTHKHVEVRTGHHYLARAPLRRLRRA
jgi:DNA-binding beta-propeller fold protein YncE